jgi:hypothetical protein
MTHLVYYLPSLAMQTTILANKLATIEPYIPCKADVKIAY